MLYHLTTTSPAVGPDGFIHLCTREQRPGVLRRYFLGTSGLRALVLDPERLDPAALRWEDSYGHGLFPHYYAPLPTEAIVGEELLPTPRAVLLDLDGTLTDPADGITRCLRYALEKLGAPVPEQALLESWIGPPLRGTLTAYLGSAEQAQQALAFYRERFAEIGWRENAVYEGIPTLLAALADAGHRLYLATAKPEVYAKRIVGHFGLDGALLGCYGSGLDGRFEHKRDLLAHLLVTESLAPEHCVMVGDREHDVSAARANGFGCLGVLWGYGSVAELSDAGAERVFVTPEALAAHLTASHA